MEKVFTTSSGSRRCGEADKVGQAYRMAQLADGTIRSIADRFSYPALTTPSSA